MTHEFCEPLERLEPVVAGRFPVLHWVVPAGEPARARKVSGNRKPRVSFARLRRGGIGNSCDLLQGGTTDE